MLTMKQAATARVKTNNFLAKKYKIEIVCMLKLISERIEERASIGEDFMAVDIEGQHKFVTKQIAAALKKEGYIVDLLSESEKLVIAW